MSLKRHRGSTSLMLPDLPALRLSFPPGCAPHFLSRRQPKLSLRPTHFDLRIVLAHISVPRTCCLFGWHLWRAGDRAAVPPPPPPPPSCSFLFCPILLIVSSFYLLNRKHIVYTGEYCEICWCLCWLFSRFCFCSFFLILNFFCCFYSFFYHYFPFLYSCNLPCPPCSYFSVLATASSSFICSDVFLQSLFFLLLFPSSSLCIFLSLHSLILPFSILFPLVFHLSFPLWLPSLLHPFLPPLSPLAPSSLL